MQTLNTVFGKVEIKANDLKVPIHVIVLFHFLRHKAITISAMLLHEVIFYELRQVTNIMDRLLFHPNRQCIVGGGPLVGS